MKIRKGFNPIDPPVRFKSEVMKDECKAIIINKFFQELKSLLIDSDNIYSINAFCFVCGKNSVIKRARNIIIKNLKRKQLKEEED